MHKIEVAQSKQDAERLAKLAHTIWNQHYVDIIGQKQVDYMLATFQDQDTIYQQILDGQNYFILSDSDLGDVGYSCLLPENNELKLSKIYVDSASKGRGFGKLMLEHAIQFADQHDAKRIWLTVNKYNHTSIEWYKRQGFVVIEEVVADIGAGYVMDDYVMALNLIE